MVELASCTSFPDYCGLDLDQVRAVAHRQACRLTGRCRLDEDGLDLRSDLVLAALERWPRFEPRRGRPMAFVAIAMSNAGASILRRRRAAKRGGDTTTVSLGEVMPGQIRGAPSGRHPDDTAHRELRLDVDQAISALPQDLARACRDFLEAAKDGRRHPSLGAAAPALRERFEALGLQEYLP
ncbi:MAG: hypothetical protein AB7Q00_09310 [Phycisphaerales bacterium]